jgi:hypothetical protein
MVFFERIRISLQGRRDYKLNLTLELMMRLPPVPPPGPKIKLFEADGDCKKNGDVMLPTGAPLFVRLKKLLACTGALQNSRILFWSAASFRREES